MGQPAVSAGVSPSGIDHPRGDELRTGAPVVGPDRFDLDPSAIDRDDPVGPFRCQRVDLVARRHDGTDSVEQAVIQFAPSRVNHRQPNDNATPPARSSS